MKRFNKKLIFFTAIILTNCSAPDNSRLRNLSEVKKIVQEYYESGRYDSDCSLIIDDAIHQIGGMNLSGKSAVIFDVDETALSNYKITKETGFGFIPKLWDEWQLKGIADAIPQTKRFYDYLISKNIHIIFLTGREEFAKESTRRNLFEKGFAKFDSLIVRSAGEKNIPAAVFKSLKREELVKSGYKIIGCVGDQESDFSGGNTGIRIRLPNYLYLLE
jgi:acid phosphatase